MRANPSQCRHEFTCVDVVAGSPPFIRCLDCDDAWELDEYPPVSEANATSVTDAEVPDAIPDHEQTWPSDTVGHDKFRQWVIDYLNPDNEPSSEHAQWRRDND